MVSLFEDPFLILKSPAQAKTLDMLKATPNLRKIARKEFAKKYFWFLIQITTKKRIFISFRFLIKLKYQPEALQGSFTKALTQIWGSFRPVLKHLASESFWLLF